MSEPFFRSSPSGWKIWLFWGWVCLSALSTSAQPLVLSSTDQVYALEEEMSYLPGNEQIKQAWLPRWSAAYLAPEQYPSPFAVDQDHWFRIALANQTTGSDAASEWVLQFTLSATAIDYYLVRGDSVLSTGHSGGFAPYSQRTFRPGLRKNYGRFILPPGQQATLYLKMRSDRRWTSLSVAPKLLPLNEFYRQQGNTRLFNGVFFGVLLLMMLYNFFLYLQVRDSAFVYYSFFLLCLGGFAMYNSGYLADALIPTFFPNFPQGLFYFKLLVYAIVSSYLLFLIKFMDLPKLLPAWYRVARWIMWLGIPACLVDLGLMYLTDYNYSWPDRVTVGYSWFFIIYLFGVCVKVYGMEAGGRKRYFIVGGVLAMATGIAITAVQRMLSVDYHALPFRITTIIEVVIFSLGLAYRQWELLAAKKQNEISLERARLHEQQQVKEAASLAELAQAKDRFYTNLTHEFRTPLTVILGLGNQLRQLPWLEQATAAEQEQYLFNLSLIQRNGDRLLQHVNQLLDMSKLSAGALNLQLTQQDIVKYTQYVLASFQSLAEERQLQLRFETDWPAKSLSFDQEKLQYILYNLLGNALKFTPTGGKITLSLSACELKGVAAIALVVSDTGMGMTPATASRVFEPYYQADSASNTTASGTGIGLTFTKELVELMNGRISIDSELGVGTTFRVCLPLSSTVLTLDEDTPAAEGLTEPARPAPPLSTEEDGPLILIVEDNTDVRYYLETLLNPHYTLLLAQDGAAGWKLAQQEVPDLIVSDVIMPQMDGFELTRRIKTHPATNHIPLILLTAKADDASKLTGLGRGADAYLMKPFQPEELLLKIQNLLHLRTALQAFFQRDELDQLPATLTAEQQLLRQLTDFVQQRLMKEDLGVHDLAEFLHLSPSQVYRKLRALSGVSPTIFIRQLRLSRAKVLLRDTSLPIADIAYEVGFADPNYFSRVFQKAVGQTPTAYRQIEGGED